MLDPIRDECFAATRSGARSLNGADDPRHPDVAELATALVATGFGYDADVRARQAEVVRRVLPRVRDIRRVGAAAIDLVWCACGRYDAYYERGVHALGCSRGVADRAAGRARGARDCRATGQDPAGVVVAPAALIDELGRLVA